MGNVGETRRSDPSASQCHIHTLDEKKVADPQLPSSRTRHFPDLGVRHQRGRHLGPGNLLQPRQDLGAGTEFRFGHHPTSGEKHSSGSPPKPGNDPVVKPRLLLYPDHNLNSSQVKVQRTLNWVLSQDSDSGTGSGTSGQSTPEPGMIHPPPVQQMKRTEVDNNLNVPDSLPTPVTSKPFTMPTNSMNTVLDSVWADQGTCQSGNWPDRGEAGLGLGQLVTRVNKNTELLDTLEMFETGGDKLWGAWDSSRDQAQCLVIRS